MGAQRHNADKIGHSDRSVKGLVGTCQAEPTHLATLDQQSSLHGLDIHDRHAGKLREELTVVQMDTKRAALPGELPDANGPPIDVAE